MYQTQIEMAELRQQEIAAWAAREQLANAATRGQRSLFARLAMSLSTLLSRPQTPAMPVRASKQRARAV